LSDLVRREAPGYESDMPIVFIPEASDKECIPQNRMSSFGFLGNLFFKAILKILVTKKMKFKRNPQKL